MQDSDSSVARAGVAFEYSSLRLRGHCPSGMYVVPSEKNLLTWNGILFIHQGYYEDSVLRFCLTFPVDYPQHPPSVHFLTDIFHPLISQQTGIFNLAPRFRPWRPKEHHVFDVLHWVKAAFKGDALDAVTESECFNKEAFGYHTATSSFVSLAKQSAALSQTSSALFDDQTLGLNGTKASLRLLKLKSEQLQQLRAEFYLQGWNEGVPAD